MTVMKSIQVQRGRRRASYNASWVLSFVYFSVVCYYYCCLYCMITLSSSYVLRTRTFQYDYLHTRRRYMPVVALRGTSSSNSNSANGNNDLPNDLNSINLNDKIIGLDITKLSTSEQERRREEERKKARTNDVVIGQTSAIPGATDYALNVASTEQMYISQMNSIEREIYKLTELASDKLKSYQLEEADQYYNAVYKLKPTAYIWQAGIVKFYLQQYYEAAQIFANSAAIYESKFGEPATEERIWRHACALKLYHCTLSKKEQKLLFEQATTTSTSSNTTASADATTTSRLNRKSKSSGGSNSISAGNTATLPLTTSPIDQLVPSIPISEYMTLEVLLRSERRRVMRIIRELYSSSIDKNFPGIILNRAKLQAIGGSTIGITTTSQQKQQNEQPIVLDRKLWKLNSFFYLGLHYDVIGNVAASKECMKRAIQLCPNGNGNDIIQTLPTLHMTRRNWFDNDPIGTERKTNQQAIISSSSLSSSSVGSTTTPAAAVSPFSIPSLLNGKTTIAAQDCIQYLSIQDSILDLRLIDLQDSMRILGLKIVGSKEELQNRLYQYLITNPELFN